MKRYGVILADPPWAYGNSGCRGAAANQYPTMSIADICALPVRDIVADDAVLYLWCTWPQLREGLQLMDAWGFSYVTGFPWVKVRSVSDDMLEGPRFDVDYGVGFWFRGATEMVLFGKRGSPPVPANGHIGLLSPNYYHSRKPDSIYELAEAHPGPRLELFARRERAGWDLFGNQAPNSIRLEEQ